MVRRILCSFMLLIILASQLAGTMVSGARAASTTGLILYVNASAGGANDGSSWADAFTNLQSALSAAVSGDQIWVASGTYMPTTNTDRTISFTLKTGVAIYGGFAGGETLLSERDPSINLTILSGDIGVADDPSDNSHHIVIGSNVDSTALLDGFTITAGNADDGSLSYPYSNGGGVFNWGGSPLLTNVTFFSNNANNGGGMFNGAGASPSLTNVIFSGNTAYESGGGIYNDHANPSLIQVTISDNTANIGGGGMFNWNASPLLSNVTISGNSADEGGGMSSVFGSIPSLIHVTISGNTAYFRGGGISNVQSNPVITNSILYGNTNGEIFNEFSAPAVTYSIVQGGYDGNIDADPLLGTLQENGGYTPTMALAAESPAIDAGDPENCPETDQRGVNRPQGSGCDLGAYEYQEVFNFGPILYVQPGGLAEGNCNTWDNACELAYALPNARAGHQVWVAAGMYKPTADSDRNKTFVLKSGVAIYGGFGGTETLLNERNLAANITILSGDIGVIDDASDNSYHVVTSSYVDSTAILNGFTITAGNANADWPNDNGSGMYNLGGSPALMNVTFEGNKADVNGGGVYNLGGSPALINVTFEDNAAAHGGGMYNKSSSLSLTSVTFSGNTATNDGGGMFNETGTLSLTNATFAGNSAYRGGGMHNQSVNSSLTHVTLSGNTASEGGGMSNLSSSPVIKNSVLYGNANGEIYNIMDSAPVVTYSIVQGGHDGDGNIDSDPLLGTLQNNGSYTSTMALGEGSPALDAGDPADCPETDQRGVNRPQGSGCDIGAYEALVFGPILYVKPGGLTGGICDNWANACKLSYALPNARAGHQVWVAAGTHKPGTDRTATFRLKSGVAVYGGFAGTEALLSERNPAANTTILSGDLNGDDQDFINNIENSYHVITGSGVDETAVLDGFTVMAGNASENSGPDSFGGGMYNDNSSPTLTSLIFSNNKASGGGGGIFNYGSNPSLTNVVFFANFANYDGGGMFNTSSANPSLMNATFFGNTANNGGGIYNDPVSSAVITNSILYGDANGEIRGASATVTYSIVQGGHEGNGNLNVDPLFINSAMNDLRLQPVSPATDAGNNSAIPGGITTDLAGNARIVDNLLVADSGSGISPIVDMGAYESQVTCPTGSRLFVDASATGANTGASWEDAFTDLQNGLSLTGACPGVSEIWVAAGTYKPTAEGDRNATFMLKSGLAIYGGFEGSETLLSERNPAANLTVLSGDIGVVGNANDNSYHVVTSSYIDNSARLDGFTITAGNANGSYPDDVGSGMYNLGGSPSLRNMTFSNNTASYGAMFNEGGSPSLINVTFDGNTAKYFGGGMYSRNASPSLTNVTFSDNTAVYQGGGIFNDTSSSSLINVTFSGNTANFGGGMYNLEASPSLTNVTIRSNTAREEGGGIYNLSGLPVITNSILYENTNGQIRGVPVTISYSIVQGGYEGGGNIMIEDPLLGLLQDNGGYTQTMALEATSPAIGAGNNAACSETDQRGVSRPQGNQCDIGAYEYQDSAAPTVTNVSSMAEDGAYSVENVIDVIVAFSEKVTVTGTPQLTLETGETDQLANYASGNGSDTLTFHYTVQVGDHSTDLDYVSTESLALNGGAIEDAVNNAAVLTLPGPGTEGSLSANKAIVIDAEAPQISNVSSTTSDGNYGIANTITITVTFTETVNVTGIPQLALETGTTDRTASYANGSGSNTLSFYYPVQAGDNSSDLDYLSTESLTLNGGTIQDAANNAAILTLPAPGGTGSLSADKTIVIDTEAPTVIDVSSSNADSAYGVGSVIDVTVTFSEPVNVAGSPQLTLETGAIDQIVNCSGGSGSNTLTFRYIVQTGDISGDLDYVSSDALTLSEGTIKDAADNAAVLTLPGPGTEGSLGASKEIAIETAAPIVMNVSSTTDDGSYGIGDSIAVTVTFSEPVYATGTPQLFLETGAADQIASYSSGSGSDTLTFQYTVQAGDSSSDLDYASSESLSLSDETIRDAANNDAVLILPNPGAENSLGANKAILIEAIAPIVTNVSSTRDDGTYGNGSVIEVTITFSEIVHVTGTPQLILETGTTDRAVDYSGGNGSHTLTFRYTVQAGESTGDLDYISTDSLLFNEGAIQDVFNNDAILTLPNPGSEGSLSANKAIVVDAVAPRVTNISSTIANGKYSAGRVIPITVTFSEVVWVTGTPRLILETGTVDRLASYVSGSGSNILTFNYIVQRTDKSPDLDYVSTAALTLNGGVIQDAMSNAAVLTLPSPGAAGSLSANKAIVIVSLTTTQFKSNGAQDGWVLESTETSVQGSLINATTATFNLGDTASQQQFRAILSFNTGTLPNNAVITSVTLKIKKQSVTGTDPFTTHKKIGVDIHKGNFGAAALQATDFQITASKPLAGLIANTPQTGWYSVNLNAASSFINLTGNTQFRLAFQKDDDNDSVADFLQFYSGNAAAANRPVLVIEYYVP